ncbi:MAG: ATP-binding protein [Alphaproteobacteria bacterium]|nr:ATP-binding protein [Alphaproteobacteria bacterium]
MADWHRMGFGGPLTGAVEKELDIERLVFLSRQRFISSAAHFVNSTLAVILLWPYHGTELLFWMLAFYAFALQGIFGWWKNRDRPRPRSAPVRIRRSGTVTAGAIGILWGVFCAYYMPADNDLVLLLLCFIITGNAAGGAIATYPLPSAAFAFIGGLMLPSMATLLTVDSVIAHLIFAMGLGYMLFLVLAVRSAYVTFVQQVTTLVEIGQLREEAESLSKAKSAFLMAVSHELRTPLNAILGFSELLRHELKAKGANGDMLTYTQHIDDSGNSLLKLINEILDVTRLEAGGVTVTEAKVDIMAAIDRAVALFRGESDRKKLTLILPDRHDAIRVRGDQHKIQQILNHLVVNAIRYTPAEGQVEIATRIGPDTVEIALHNSGDGISEHEQSEIFEPFTRTPNALKTTAIGVGLGLPLSRKLARLHGGDVTLESEAGRGTTVLFTLPADRLLP